VGPQGAARPSGQDHCGAMPGRTRSAADPSEVGRSGSSSRRRFASVPRMRGSAETLESWTRTGIAWLRRPGNRSVVVAGVVAFGLRLAWVIWATKSPLIPGTDTARYLSTALELASRHTPSRNGLPSAATAVGYPATLAPLLVIVNHVGGPSPIFTAALLNVVIGTAAIPFAAMLGRLWLGQTARTTAAWLLAVAPSQIYMTSVAMVETLMVTLVLAGVAWGTVLVARGTPVRRGWWVAFGAFVAYAALVNPLGLLLLAVPALSIRGRSGSWRGARRHLGLLLATVGLVLLPMFVRNGVQVGVWSPFSSGNANAACIGQRPHSNGVGEVNRATLQRCFILRKLRPGETVEGAFIAWFNRPLDEGHWYYENLHQARSWALGHPLQQVPLSYHKLLITFRDDDEALSTAQDFGNHPLAGPSTLELLNRVNAAWYWGVLLLAGLGLAFRRELHRAVPIWAVPALSLIGVAALHGTPRYHHPVMGLVVVSAAATVAAIRAPAPGRR